MHDNIVRRLEMLVFLDLLLLFYPFGVIFHVEHFYRLSSHPYTHVWSIIHLPNKRQNQQLTLLKMDLPGNILFCYGHHKDTTAANITILSKI